MHNTLAHFQIKILFLFGVLWKALNLMDSSSRQRYYMKLANEDSGTIAPEQNCRQDNCSRIIVPWTIASQIIAREHNFPQGKLLPPSNNCLLDNCPQWIITQGKFSPRKFPPHHLEGWRLGVKSDFLPYISSRF